MSTGGIIVIWPSLVGAIYMRRSILMLIVAAGAISPGHALADGEGCLYPFTAFVFPSTEEQKASPRDYYLKAVYSECQIGDLIQVPPDQSVLIATVCDFNKPVTATGRVLFCFLGPRRALRSDPKK